MKKLNTLLLTAIFSLSAVYTFAQSNRMAFVEEATQASCGPCAGANPGIQALVNENSDNTIFMAYQVWWPGFDPMYEDNSAEVDERVGNYYDYSFAPQLKVNGAFPGTDGGADQFSQESLDDITSQMSEFDMELYAEVVDGILEVTGDVSATMAAAGDLKLRIMVLENTIYAADAPGGTNGETEYHHVFKAFVGGTAGIDLEDAWEIGDSYEIEQSFDLSSLNIYGFDQLEVVAIVQNDDTKFIHQAAKADGVDITVSFNTNAGAVEVDGFPAEVCSGDLTVNPMFTLGNFGNNDLTSATITYSINGGAAQTMSWTGNISTLGTEVVELDAYTFAPEASNTINVTVSEPNGQADEESGNDTYESTFAIANAPESESAWTLTINTDCWATESGWEVTDAGGTVIAETAIGTYAGQNESEIIENISLPALGCYTFKFFDDYGDGMNGSQWGSCDTDGNYTLSSNGMDIASYDGSTEFSEASHLSEVTTLVSLDELSGVDVVWSVYPNPTNGLLNLNYSLTDASEVQIRVMNVLGEQVIANTMGTQVAGQHLETLDLAGLNAGIYMVQLNANGNVSTQRVVLK